LGSISHNYYCPQKLRGAAAPILRHQILLQLSAIAHPTFQKLGDDLRINESPSFLKLSQNCRLVVKFNPYLIS
jgi:hypothetical protein